MQLFSHQLKKSCFFLGKPLAFFITFSSDVLIFFSCFHFFMFLFLQMFSGVFIIDCIFSLHCFFTFCEVLRFCAVVSKVLRIWESFFYSQAFFALHPFSTFGPTCFYQGFPEAGSTALKIAGPPTEVRNTDPAHLLVRIIQFSAKGISR